MGFLSITQTAEKWGFQEDEFRFYAEKGRIQGARKIESYWAVSDDAVKQKDKRMKSGKYIKSKNTDE